MKADLYTSNQVPARPGDPTHYSALTNFCNTGQGILINFEANTEALFSYVMSLTHTCFPPNSLLLPPSLACSASLILACLCSSKAVSSLFFSLSLSLSNDLKLSVKYSTFLFTARVCGKVMFSYCLCVCLSVCLFGL